MNIFDLAGNLCEWTLECSCENGSYGTTARGGSAWSYGSNAPASSRRMSYGWKFINYESGFRVAIY